MDHGTFVPSTVQDWYTFIQIIKQSNDIHQTISKFSAEVSILDHLLKAIKSERDDLLKINLLVVLQEYTCYFLEDDPKGRIEKICSSLNSILSTQTDVNNALMFQVKNQVLITFTTMFIDQMVIKSQPKVFETFVDALLDMVSKVNSGPDRLLRATACQCLQEFELCYPGLLSSCLPRLFQAFLSENSHVSQSYVTLFTTAFQHAVQLFELEIPATVTSSPVASGVFRHSLPRSFSSSQLAASSSLSLVMPDTPAGPFVIPSITRYGPAFEVNAMIPDVVAKEVQRGVSMLVEQSVQLNEWGLSALTELLVPVVNLARLPPTLLRHPNFYRLMFVNQPLFFHQLLYLAILFPDVYSADHSLIISRIIMTMRDILLPVEQRMLAITWLIALTRPAPSPPFNFNSSPFHSPTLSSSSSIPPPLSLNSSSSHISPPTSPPFTPTSSNSNIGVPFAPLPPLLFEHFRAFYPTVFDSLDLKEAKLHALLKCFSIDPPSAAPPNNLLEVLLCLDDFRFFQPESRQTTVVFAILYRTLTYFPHLLDDVYSFALTTIRTRPHFLFNLIRLIDALAHAHNAALGAQGVQASTSPLVLRMLENFEKVLCAMPPRKLEAYLALAERIVMEPLIDPTGILVAIRNYLRVVSDGHWGYGQVMISISRWALLRHQKMKVFKPLGELLSFMASFYPDIEIRDRAHFYLLMLTHLPPEKITLVLTQQNTPSDEENVGFVSPFVPKTKTVKSLPKFLSLLRVFVAQPDIELNDSEFVPPPDTTDPFTIYSAYINSPTLSIVISIPFELSYKYPPLAEVFPKKVYALLVQFTPNPAYETLAPLRIPYLAMTEDQKPTAVGFPYLYKLVLKFRPKFPLPASFSVKSLFNDGDGKTCKGEIDPVSVNFQDLYMEVPIPPSVTTPKAEFLRILFDSLWKANSPKSNKESIKSVKFLELSHTNMIKSLTYIERFVIEEPDTPNGSTKEISEQPNENNNNDNDDIPDLDKKEFVCQKRALLFLPTKYHVIMKFLIYKDQTLVKIRTDFWQILSYLDAFFNVMLGV